MVFTSVSSASADEAAIMTVYLSEEEAVRLQMDSEKDRFEKIDVELSDTEIEFVRKKYRIRMFTDEYRIYAFYKKGSSKPYRHAIFLQEPGQHQYIDLMYGVNPDGEIHRIDVLVYREPYGDEVQSRRFMRQFEGKSLRNSKFMVNQDIIHIVGATISTHSVSRAARRALGILELRGYIR